jgi:hypothetical protein
MRSTIPARHPTGETVARAKRTARAEARRRYRAATELAFDTEDDTTESAAAPRSVRQPTTGNPADSSKRIGIFEALRVSIHPVRLREDLALLPKLVIDKALWIPFLAIAATALAVVVVGRSNIVVHFATTYFLEMPAIGGVFLAGFLALRASWLLGILVGLGSAIAYTVLLYVAPSSLYPPDMYKTLPEAGTVQALAVQSFAISPVMGAFFAAAAAWYRRFLRLSNPNRNRQAAAPRRGDGRTRGASSSQKAGARR